MSTATIAFIGAGNMASSIIGGLLNSGHPAGSIRAADPFPESLERLAALGPVGLFDDNAAAVSGADVVVLAVKPQVMAEAADSIAAEVAAGGAVVVSIAAGITIETLEKRLGRETAIVRCMPNTPALLGCGASALYANGNTTDEQRAHAEGLLNAVGLSRWVPDESAMVEGDVDLVELRRRVTSPGGTTERAVQQFETDDLRGRVAAAMRAAFERSIEMARDMG